MPGKQGVLTVPEIFERPEEGMDYLQAFVYLQVLDFLTTWAGLRMGASELSPFISWLMGLSDPLIGLFVAKVIGFLLCGLCLWMRRPRVIWMANYIFALLVAWNMYHILLLTARVSG